MATKSAMMLSLPSAVLLAAVTGAVGYAIGSATSASHTTTVSTDRPPMATADPEMGEALPMGHPAVSGEVASDLPPGHPAVNGGAAAQMPTADPGASTLHWAAPARWVVSPNTSSMRLATYKVPRAAGDPEDADVSVTQVGGSLEANIDRWIGQFDAAARGGVKRTQRTVHGLSVVIVEIHGTYSSGMDPSADRPHWALLAAIVETPGMPHFFKITGPEKTVTSARSELDELIGSLKT